MEFRYFLSIIFVFALGVGAASAFGPGERTQLTQRSDRAHTSSVSGEAVARHVPGGPRRYSRGSRPEPAVVSDLDSQRKVPAMHYEAEFDSVPGDALRRNSRGTRPKTVATADLDSQERVPAMHYEAEFDSVPNGDLHRVRDIAQR
ncbi:MAG: hypothetical protein AAGH83_08850 [Pseudomonadota bacterium]